MRSDEKPYEPIMPVSEWLAVSINTKQLEIARYRFEAHFSEATEEVRKNLVSRVMRESAVESGALENLYFLKPGESRIIAEEGDNWEEVLDGQDGVAAMKTFNDLIEALEYAMTWVEEGRPVTAGFIRDLHKIVCRSQSEVESAVSINGELKRVKRALQHGKFKTAPNYVETRSGEIFRYCPPELVTTEISKLCAELQNEEFDKAHPAVQAAYAHYCLARIHPFDDGNGRVSRILASLFLLKAYGVPLVVYSDRKSLYLQALEMVDKGDYRQLVQDVADRSTATLSELSQILEMHRRPDVEDNLRDLAALVAKHDAVDLANVEVIHERLFEALDEAVRQRMFAITASSDGLLESSRPNPRYGVYQYVGTDSPYTVDHEGRPYNYIPHRFGSFVDRVNLELLKDSRSTDISADAYFGAGFSDHEEEYFPFILVALKSSEIYEDERIGVIRLRYEDCFPTLGTTALTRIETLAESMGGYLINRIAELTRDRLEKTGSYFGS